MILCELCKLQSANLSCTLGNKIPKKMKCEDFTPAIDRICATPADYARKDQVYQMAVFFGLKGKELKRVQAM
jgi:hypothetical protein